MMVETCDGHMSKAYIVGSGQFHCLFSRWPELTTSRLGGHGSSNGKGSPVSFLFQAVRSGFIRRTETDRSSHRNWLDSISWRKSPLNHRGSASYPGISHTMGRHLDRLPWAVMQAEELSSSRCSSKWSPKYRLVSRIVARRRVNRTSPMSKDWPLSWTSSSKGLGPALSALLSPSRSLAL